MLKVTWDSQDQAVDGLKVIWDDEPKKQDTEKLKITWDSPATDKQDTKTESPSLLEDLGTIGKYGLEKVGELGTSVAESFPKVAGSSIQGSVIGALQTPLDIAAGTNALEASLYGKLGLDKLASNLRKSTESYKDYSKSIESGVKSISPEYINRLTPGEQTAASIGSLVLGGVGGAGVGSVLAGKKASTVKKVLSGLAGETLGTSVAGGSTVNLEPSLLGTEDSDYRLKNRIYNPTENLLIGLGIIGAKPAYQAAKGLLSKSSDQAIGAVKESGVTEAASDYLSSLKDKTKENVDLAKQGTLDRFVVDQKIEAELKGTPDNLESSNLPMSTQSHLEMARENATTDYVLNQGVPITRANGEADLITKGDLGISGPEAVEKVPGIVPIFNSIKEAGGDVKEALKYLTYKRIQRDYAIKEADEMEKFSAITKAKNAIVDADEALRKTSVPPEGASTEERIAALDDYRAKQKALSDAQDSLKAAEAMEPRRVDIGVPIDEVNKYITENSSKPWAKVAEKEFGLFFKAIRQRAVSTGNLSQEEAKYMEDFYGNDYFPAFRKEQEVIDNTKKLSIPSASRGKGFFKAKGGKDPYEDPLDSLIKYTSGVTQSAQRNLVLNNRVDLYEKMPEEMWNKYFNTSKEDYYKQVYGSKAASEMNLLNTQDLNSFTDPVVKEGTLSFFRNGRKVSLSIKDKALAESIDSMIPPAPSKLRTGAKLAKDIQRTFITTIDPIFSLSNAFRDAVTAAASSQAYSVPQNPLTIHVKGLYRRYKDPVEWQKYLLQTGGGTSKRLLGEARTEREIQNAIRTLKANYYANSWLGVPYNTAFKILDGVKTPYKAAEGFSFGLENAPRFEVYAAEKAAKNPEWLSTIRSKEATVDFSRQGSNPVVRDVNDATIFLNANLQGMKTFTRLLKQSAKIGSKTQEFALRYLTAPAIILYGYNSQYDSYFDIPEDIRHNNWIIKTGPGPREYIRIPMDREISPIFAGIPMALLDDIRTGTNGAQAINQIVKSVEPLIGPSNFTPGLGQIAWDIGTNTNSFTGSPIVPKGLEDKAPKYQFTETTSPTFRVLGSKLGLSPIKLEYASDRFFNDFSDLVSSALDDRYREVLGIPEGPTQGIRGVPGLRKFFGTDSKDATGAVYTIANNMKGDLSDLEEALRVSKGLETDKGTIKMTEEWLKDNKNKVQFLTNLRDVLSSMNQDTQSIHGYLSNPDTNPDQKRYLLEKAIEARDVKAKFFLDQVRKDPALKQFYGYRYGKDSSILHPVPSITKMTASKLVGPPSNKLKEGLSKLGITKDNVNRSE